MNLPWKNEKKWKKILKKKSRREQTETWAKKWAWKCVFASENIEKMHKNGIHEHWISREKNTGLRCPLPVALLLFIAGWCSRFNFLFCFLINHTGSRLAFFASLFTAYFLVYSLIRATHGIYSYSNVITRWSKYILGWLLLAWCCSKQFPPANFLRLYLSLAPCRIQFALYLLLTARFLILC